jgi:P2-related tail formation protein
MIIALVDNGSLEPAAPESLRRAAAAIGALAGVEVAAVSWRHSDRIPAAELGGTRAWVLGPWVRDQVARGEREFVFVPFFISAQGAIGSALRIELEALQADGALQAEETRSARAPAFSFTITAGLAAEGVLPAIIAARIRETAVARGLHRPAVVIVDHGGPSPSSAAVRDDVAAAAGELLAPDFPPPVAASMESPAGPGFAFNRPLLAEALDALPVPSDVIIAPLFLSPGRHAGPSGDLAQIVREAAARRPGLRGHFTGLVGSHPLAMAALARTLRAALAPSVAVSP